MPATVSEHGHILIKLTVVGVDWKREGQIGCFQGRFEERLRY